MWQKFQMKNCKKVFLSFVFLGLALALGCQANRNQGAQPQQEDPKYRPAGQPANGGGNAAPSNNNPSGGGGAPMPEGGGGAPLPEGGGGAPLPVGKTTPLIPPPLPRVLVYMQGERGDEINTDIEQVFSDEGFKLIDRNQLENIKEVDSALSNNDKDKLLFLKTRYGIEIIAAGKIRWAIQESSRTYGRTTNLFKGNITLKAIEADSAEIVYSKAESTELSGRDVVLNRLAKSMAQAFAEKLRQHWAKKKYQGQEFDVVISKAAFNEHLSPFESYIKGVAQVTSAARRSYAKNTAFYGIGFRGQASELEKAILDCPTIEFRLVRTTANRIEVEVVGTKNAPVKIERGPEIGSKFLIEGEVDKPGSRVWVNGDEVTVENGRWKTYIDITKVKTIVIKAVDPNGNETVQTKNIGGGSGKSPAPSDVSSSDGTGGNSTNPSPGNSGDPSPGSSGDPSPGSSGDPSPGSSGDPSPGSSGNPSPGGNGFPTPQMVGRSTSGSTEWFIKNGTTYALYISYNGADNGSISIDPGKSTTLFLKGGTYVVKGSSGKSNVLPYHGGIKLKAGYKYRNDFFIRSR